MVKLFLDPYYVVELNQRSDYTVLESLTLSISDDKSSVTGLQYELNSSIEFSGGGLYHFRAYAIKNDYTHCDLMDEFIVFIDEVPLPNPSRDVVRLTTGMLFTTCLFFTYLWYLYCSNERNQNRVFPD